ncbi:MAG: Smr/MutS family protein [Crocinitomicaceae bacterium]|nr:Smr/MutS family protein [Crocinitomicaceae bacterium]
MQFSVGEKVVFLRESGGGIVKSINSKGLYIIEDESGFEKPYRSLDLAKIHGEDYKIDDDHIALMHSEASFTKMNHTVHKEQLTGKRKPVDVWEIDLHIEEITESHRGLSNAQILTKQMNAFKIFLNKARARSIRKVIVIHGVGEGVLKEEIRFFLDGVMGIEFYDADFRKYGKGATAIEIRYN